MDPQLACRRKAGRRSRRGLSEERRRASCAMGAVRQNRCGTDLPGHTYGSMSAAMLAATRAADSFTESRAR